MRSVLVLTLALSTLALSTLVACGPAAPPPPPPPPPPAPESPQVSLADVGLDASAMNRDAKPCEDFYEYACGGWVKKTEIPADRSRWVRSFSEINERNEQDLKRIVESAASAPKTPVDHAIGDYYAGCMDEAAIEKDGLSSIQLYLDVAGSVAAPGRAKRSLDDALTELHKVGVDAFFDLASTQDFQDATKVIAEIDQGGLGLPDRDYYLEDDDKMKDIRAFYVQHVAHMLELSGVPKQAAKKQAEAILRLETKIAEISKTRVERRDPKGMYNNIGKSGLLERKKGLDWEAYLKRRGLEAITDLNVTSIPFVEGLGELLKREPKPTIASYLRWQVLHSVAPSLGKAFVDEDFALTQKLFGTEQLLPRWKRCVASTDFALGELLAQAFVAERFSPESKQAVIQMVREIGKAMGERLAGLEWMDPTTKKRAEEKLAAMDYLIGYPDKWRHYDFPIDRAHHPKNRLLATAWEVNRDLGKIGKPVDRGEWFMTPPTVNAYYSPLRNHMVFPAGILQPPFYNPKASVAVNMGAMGMVVGHELTHGFDDQGSQFDAKGNLSSWWEPATRDQFVAKTKCVEDEYAAFEVLPGVTLNGKLTLGENIADAGGVKLAFRAYRALRGDVPARPIAEGLNEDQQFFVSLGQVWCAKYREAFARASAKTDPHSTPRFRVNGSLMNTPEFAEAFACPAGSPMVPKNACTVW
ncbi:MAG: M13 family metallopeptidase [Myxococcales bacterium]|nr:M13 family metallopeptidase [Myxococcales bacterium]